MKHLYFFIVLFLATLSINAQRIINRRTPSLAVGLQMAEPKGEFAQNFDGYPFGVAGNFTAPIGNSPFEMGVGFAWNSMGANDEEVSVLIGQDAAGDDIYDMGTMRIRSNNYRYQAVARFRPFVRGFQIYGDLVAGVERFTTSTDVKINSSGYTEVIDANTVQRDFGWNVGWAVGTRIRLAGALFLDARFEKMEGGAASFVNQESIVINEQDNTLQFETKESRTDKFTYQLGIAIQF